MACNFPVDAWRPDFYSGTRQLIFSYDPSRCAGPTPDLQVPCGRCKGCRFEHSRQWAVRCMHESSMFQHNCMLNLTYKPSELPLVPGTDQATLFLAHYQKFMKRLRKRFSGVQVVRIAEHLDISNLKTKRFSKKFLANVSGPFTEVNWSIRFYHAGEYGEKRGRPHYHALLFNFDFPDRYYWRKSQSGFPLYRSPILESLWPHGHCEIGDVSFESAAYVARYILKKVNGEQADSVYGVAHDIETGELLSRSKEYSTMSRDPGIGSLWYDKFNSDVFPNDYVVVNGRKCRPPRYYDAKLKAVAPEIFDEVIDARQERADKQLDFKSPERLAVREHLTGVRISKLKRSIDS